MKILFIVTSHAILGSTGKATGFHFSEMGEPYAYLKDQGYGIDFASPLGGKAPVIGYDEADPLQRQLKEDAELQHKLNTTLKPSEINPQDYQAIYYVGGHGVMWDFAGNQELTQLTAHMYEDGKIVAAVCHGPAGLVNVKLSDGSYLVNGKRIAAFSDDEERAIGLENTVPFMLESTLAAHGARYTKAPLWQENIEVDQRIVTGQNPASALGVAKAIDGLLQESNRTSR